MPDGATVVVEGVLTTPLGALESGRTAFLQDLTAGIAIYLDAAVVVPMPAGTVVRVAGETASRYEQRTLRASEADITNLGEAALPAPMAILTGVAGEAVEGSRIAVSGTVVGGTDALADGTAVSVDDGSGPVRVVVTPHGLAGRALTDGDIVEATGPLGQRDSSGTDTAGYRLYVTDPADLVIAAPPSPTPTPAPTATPSPTPTASPTVMPTPTPIATPTPLPSPTASATPIGSIAQARAADIGTAVTVVGIVTAEGGRLGTPPLIAIEDATAGIIVRVPDGSPVLRRGAVVRVDGPLAAPYGQTEIRPAPGHVVALGTGVSPAPIPVDRSTIGEATEARLVTIDGRLERRPTKSTSGDLVFDLVVDGGTVRVAADASTEMTISDFAVGATYRLTGVIGQHATRKGALDGYRIWLRDRADVRVLSGAPGATPGPTDAPTPRPTAGSTGTPRSTAHAPALSTIANARRASGAVVIEGVVTAAASLLDATGRRIVVQDASGAVEVLLPKDERAPGVGTRVRSSGRMGTAYGAPRFRADQITALGTAPPPTPLLLHGAPKDALVWRLVAITGRVEDVRKLGDRWLAELLVGSVRVPVIGQPGAGIPVSAITEGRTIGVTGIVRMAFPSATDRRPAILPRSKTDLRDGGSGAPLGSASGSKSPEGAPSVGAGAGSSTDAGTARMTSTASAAVPDVDLRDLDGRVGLTVRVGGLVAELRHDGFLLDDDTAVRRILLAGDAAPQIPLIEPGDAVNVVGRVATLDDGTVGLVVVDASALALGSRLSPAERPLASGSPGPSGSGSSSPTDPDMHAVAAGLGDLPGLPGTTYGLASLLFVVAASLGVTWIRRRHAHRVAAARIAVRLGAVVGRPASTGVGIAADRVEVSPAAPVTRDQ